MATIELGASPKTMTVNLSPEADFRQQLQATDAAGQPDDWQAGESVTLVFDVGVSWAASIEGDIATWAVPAAEVADLIALMGAESNRRVRLQYHADPDTDLPWGVGLAVIQ